MLAYIPAPWIRHGWWYFFIFFSGEILQFDAEKSQVPWWIDPKSQVMARDHWGPTSRGYDDETIGTCLMFQEFFNQAEKQASMIDVYRWKTDSSFFGSNWYWCVKLKRPKGPGFPTSLQKAPCWDPLPRSDAGQSWGGLSSSEGEEISIQNFQNLFEDLNWAAYFC